MKILFLLLVPALLASDSVEHGRLVKLDVIAVDSKGGPIPDLNASDIEVREDGKLRPAALLRFAGHVRGEKPSPGVFANRPGPIPYVILLDRWNERLLTTASSWLELSESIKGLESTEGIYVYFLTNQGEILPIRPVPATETEAFTPPPSPSQLAAKIDDAAKHAGGFREVDALDPIIRANTTVKALSWIFAAMRVFPDRKNFIWITHGFPLQIPERGGGLTDLTDQLRLFCASAIQEQVAIYAVDQSAKGAGESLLGVERLTLQLVPSLTGGRWYGSGSVTEAMSGAAADSKALYTLAYYSPNLKADHRFRKIRLTTPRKGVRLLAQDGYYGDEPEADESEVIAGARNSFFDATGIGLEVKISLDKSTRVAQLNIRVDPRDLLLDGYRASLSVTSATYADGILKDASPPVPVSLNLSVEQLARAPKEGVEFTLSSEIPDGTQKFRLIVFDRLSGTVGSAMLEIPRP